MTDEPLAVVAGGTGFIGRAVTDGLSATGWRVRTLGRGQSGPVDVVADLGTGSVPEAALAGARVLLHLVGRVRETEAGGLAPVHVTGTRALLAAARRAGVERVVFISALGADPAGVTAYFRTKAAAEDLVRGWGGQFAILRPAPVFGAGAQLFRLLADQVQHWPLVPVPGPGTARWQPVALTELVGAVVRVAAGAADGQTVAAVGPEVLTYDQLLASLANRLGRPLRLVHLPLGPLLLAAGLAAAWRLPLPATPDQLRMLTVDLLADPGPFADLLPPGPRLLFSQDPSI